MPHVSEFKGVKTITKRAKSKNFRISMKQFFSLPVSARNFYSIYISLWNYFC